ncbi:Lrp/AsnC family transcriptional regulator [Oceanospirillum beijerinckii]|uniref:Lrp/AsnC family transcriptional regulator n=1 Tax=Oceanospirillum beijerinckii TaxID=64976 RepID=UPI0004044A79|nr:Lrp/AsnC family transcriptional regulator [Oceanospirillum beijerinckii]MAC47184.1 Lrp/AsnC family transcriptional regulator [Oceanospirillum sp.]
MDKFDQAIIDLLTQNARQPVAAIGDTIGLSRTAVNERIRKLEEKGVIRRYTIELGHESQEQALCAYFELTFRPFDPIAVKQQLQAIPEIRQAHALSGSTDVLLFVQTRSMERLNQVRQQLSSLANLDKLVTSTAMEQLV